MRLDFFITRRNELFAGDELVDRFASEAAAADAAVRFAQDNDALYAVLYERRAA